MYVHPNGAPAAAAAAAAATLSAVVDVAVGALAVRLHTGGPESQS